MPCCRLSVPVAMLLAALFAAGCSGTRPATPRPEAQPRRRRRRPSAGRGPARPALAQDVHSYARPAEARVTHVSLDLTADMAAQTLAGTATLTVAARPDAREVVLDTRDLDIERVTDAAGAPLAFRVGAADPLLGAPLTVALPPADPLVGDMPGSRLVVVHYTTVADGGGRAVARAGPDVVRPAVHVHAGRGHPHADVDPDAGQPRHPPDLRRRPSRPRPASRPS